MDNRHWLHIAVCSAIFAGCLTAVMLLLPFGWATAAVVVAVAVFLIVLLRNPAFWHRRLAFGIFTVWAAAVATTGLSIQLNIGNSFATFALGEFHWLVHIVVAVLIAALLYYDLKRTQAAVANATELVGITNESLSTVSTERERLVSSVDRDQRAKLVFGILQAETQFFQVDTDNLTKAQQHELALRQIETKEKQILALERRRSFYVVAVLLGCLVCGSLVVSFAYANSANDGVLEFSIIKMDTQACWWYPIEKDTSTELESLRSISQNLGGAIRFDESELKRFPLHSHDFDIRKVTDEQQDQARRVLDPVLDITLINHSDETVLLNELAIEILDAWYEVKGLPQSGKLYLQDAYEIHVSAIKPGHRDSLSLDDPVYLEPDAPYRFKLWLKDFAKVIRESSYNECVLNIVLVSSRGQHRSVDINLGVWH